MSPDALARVSGGTSRIVAGDGHSTESQFTGPVFPGCSPLVRRHLRRMRLTLSGLGSCQYLITIDVVRRRDTSRFESATIH